jgi:hypothetical protein
MAEKGLSWKQCVDTCTDSGMINGWGKHMALLCTLKPLHQIALLATVSNTVNVLLWKRIKGTENSVMQGCEDFKFYKIKTTKFKNFQCTLWWHG